MVNRGIRIGVGVLVVGGILVAAVALRAAPDDGSEPRGTLEALKRDASTDAFARAFGPRDFTFPQDHGPHDDFQTEWWYYTGNLSDVAGRHFGYQLTFFRRALVSPDQQAAVDARPSDFAFTQLYFAHFAVTDTEANEHVSFDRYSRAAAGLAGARAEPFNVFIEDWSAAATLGSGGAETVRLTAQDDGYAIELELRSSKPIVLHGDRGLSQKSPERGNASYYYSMTRMSTRGRVITPQGHFDVAGDNWLDREWSTSALDEGTEGWDWFSLQLDDRREIMFYQLRLTDGTSAAVSKGTYVDAAGEAFVLERDDVQITVLDTWTSPDSGAGYPNAWRFAVPKYGLDLEITPRVKDQEMKLPQRYWEGAVTISGASGNRPAGGVGYVELTGYRS
jgi:predicted secreted hydrolase